MPHTNLSWRTVRPLEGFYTSEVQATDPRPVRTFLPTGYEPNYPHPLLVFFHGHAGNEEQILRLAPRLSRRNYLCIRLLGPHLLWQRQDGPLGHRGGAARLRQDVLPPPLLRRTRRRRAHLPPHPQAAPGYAPRCEPVDHGCV